MPARFWNPDAFHELMLGCVRGSSPWALSLALVLATSLGGSAAARATSTAVDPPCPSLAVRAAGVLVRALELLHESEDERWRAAFELRVLRIGTPLPAGLPPGRVAQREVERRADREALAAELAPDAPKSAAALAWLEAELARRDDARRWMAAARVVGRFGVHSLAPSLALGLDREREPWVRAAAREALYELCRLPFDDPGSFHAFWIRAGGGPRDRFFLEALELSEHERLQWFERWLKSAPAEALAYLGDPDPRKRSRAARIVASAIAAGTLPPEQGVAALLNRLAEEPDASVFAERVQAVLDPLLGEQATAPRVRELRAVLADAIERGIPGIEVAVARALRSLPWIETQEAGANGGANGGGGAGGPKATGGSGASAGEAHSQARFEDSAGYGLVLLTKKLERLPADAPFHDVDVSLTVLHAIESLAQRLAEAARAAQAAALAGGAAASGAVSAPVATPGSNGDPRGDLNARTPSDARRAGIASTRSLLGAWIADEQRYVGERIGAVKALTPLAGDDDLSSFVAALRAAEPPRPDLRFALLGSIGELASELELPEERRVELAREIDRHLDESDPDLRRLALQLLAQPELAAAAGRPGLEHWIRRLDAEPIPELRDGLLRLVRDHGGAYEVRPLLALEHFDALFAGDPREGVLARGDVGRAQALGATLAELSDGSTQLTIDAARRLARAPDPATLDVRRRSALSMVARLAEEHAAALSSDAHLAIVGWAFELCRARHGVRAVTPNGRSMLERVAVLHLPAAAAEHEIDPTVRAYVIAELAVTAKDDPAWIDEARSAFARALELAPDPTELRLARARYRDRWGDVAAARAEFRAVSAERPDALDVADQRRVAALVAAVGSAEPGAPGEAFERTWRLVHDPRWPDEVIEARIDDLGALVERARATGERAPLARVVALLGQLEAVVGERVPGVAPTPGSPALTPSEAPGADAPRRDDSPTDWTRGLVGVSGGAEAELRTLLAEARAWLDELARQRAVEVPEAAGPVPDSDRSG